MKYLLVSSLATYLLTALISLFLGKRARLCGVINGIGGAAAAIQGLIPVLFVMAGALPLDIHTAWSFPVGSFHMHLDILSAWFSIPILLISTLAAIYGNGYMSHYGNRRRVSLNWFFFQLLAGGMFFVLIAWDGVSFLIAWEVMSIAAWFLVMFEHELASVQKAGWIYLVATHLGTAFLFFMFVMLKNVSGSFDFSGFAGLGISANLLFVLAVLGFGSKAGFFGLHVWLPEAHPAAPSHVSGVMSGVMIKTGIYGLLRMMTLTKGWSDWWGWLLIIIGVTSGLGGVLFALVQHDLKRLLAYHSVENIGIICLGLGIGVLGIQYHHPIAILGIAGALLHVLNHAIFKTALFMGAGSVVQAAGTRNIDLLGGLQKRMPITALTFLVAAAAICGLPPLNGFVSELLIYFTSYKIVMFGLSPGLNLVVAGFVSITALALIGGFAVLCFTKVFGAVFLGEPRTPNLAQAHEAPRSMHVPMLILAAICLILGLGGFFLMKLIAPVAAFIHARGMAALDVEPLHQASIIFYKIFMLTLVLFGVFASLWFVRSRLLKKRSVTLASTWGCGYPHANPRMQYTGSSFAEPLQRAFRSLFHTEEEEVLPSTYLPSASSFSSHTSDPFMRWVYNLIFTSTAIVFRFLRRIQHGRMHVYILYLLLALAVIFVWSFL